MRSKVWLLAITLFACGGTAVTTTLSPTTTAATGTSAAPATTDAVASGFPVTLSAANGPVTLAERPEAIISLAPTATEMLGAIGAMEQVVAVDDQSNYPPDIPIT
ncbi:MAG TPA: ABC transporter substrate-binding protein, partial [Acidimicrobiia bacterium]